MLPALALIRILPRILALAALAGLLIAAAAHAGVLVDWVVSAVVWVVEIVGGGAVDVVAEIVQGIIDAIGRDAVGM